MANTDAEERFFGVVRTFKSADDKARESGLSKIDAEAFNIVIIDLDAAIPGLTGVILGRALG